MALVNRNVTGKARGGIPSGSARLTLSQVDSNDFGEASNINSVWWNLKSTGDYLYGARGTSGVSVIDCSTPSTMTETFDSFCHNLIGGAVGYRCMDVAVTGNTMVTVTRSGSFETTGIGYLETWDITTPASTASLDVYSKNASDALEASPHLYSAVAMFGTYACVSGQKSGFFVFDVSTPATIVLTGSLTTGSWETQGLCVHNVGGADYAFCANYGFGIRAVGLGTPATPADTGALSAYTGGSEGHTLRPWDCVADGDYLFCSVNTSGAQGDSVDRGLLVADISNPASMSWAGHCAIPSADQDTWNVSADRPYLGITRYGNHVFIAGGHGGVAVFDVSDPTNPQYRGMKGLFTADDNIYSCAIVTVNGVHHLAYGDGAHPTTATGSQQIYFEQIHIK